MKEVKLADSRVSLCTASFLARLATILEFPVERLPRPAKGEDPATGRTLARWLGGLGLGLARVADPASFSWGGPWIARLHPPQNGEQRCVVMYGVPSGLLWDPGGDGTINKDWIEEGHLVAAEDIALAMPPGQAASPDVGTIEAIWIAPVTGVTAKRFF